MTEQANQQGGGEPSKPQRKIPRVEQAAILLMSLGEADA
ncbi:MAG TPA: flagellar motor switch protein FliG, partial [Marinobacter adhaerens]|nr:flagellar motor switch protein FliG [Marinobacter adhaerens]HBC35689.1 flagellar motor switch protein FliG [Marinobacter adhaerens]HBI79963.1 flagellar motor switch protein FliG [Marinobacter adhaerens]HCA11484.1 flagellar motor switch protein FliG [Marinobacter adhaerens]